MLSSVVDAEDIVQDVWLRWQSCDRDAVRNALAYLMTTTTRMCINHMQSAHARRETYAGPWLPEPVDTSADPALGAERCEALQVATLILLERLSPTERAAYILREAFDYPYELIGSTIQVTEVNARQLVSRARRRLSADRRESTRPADPRRLLGAFVTAAHTGDMRALETVFAAEAAC
jgi:RNA polymerase sigma-70 factor (ECF subfamily)